MAYELRIRSILSPIIIVVSLLGWDQALIAQVSAGGRPYTFTNPVADTVHTVIMAPVDVAALLAEDELEAQQGKHVPPRFGYPFEVSLGFDSAGTWITLPNGHLLWRLRIVSGDAYAINLLYDEFNLLPGAKFFIYNEDRSMVLGAFSPMNNKDHGKFSTGPVKGSVSILEYYEPTYVENRGVLL